MKKYFGKEVVMTKEDDENFGKSKKCLICDKIFFERDVKVRDYCHVPGKCKGAALRDCNINVSLSNKVPIVFHNLNKYDIRLIMQELGRFDFKINVILNGLDKCVSFSLDNNLVFIDSFQFLTMPSINKFHSSLSGKGISDKDHQHVLKDEKLSRIVLKM